MFLVYILQGWNWRDYWLHWRQFWGGSSGKLTIAVGSGSFAALSTYVAASIWANSENRWLATGAILQGLGTLLTLALLGWSLLSSQQKKQESQFEQLIRDLTVADPLKRLIAVRQLSALAEKGYLSPTDQSHLKDYLNMMIVQEQEDRVKKAILEALAKKDKMDPHSQPLPLLTNFSHPAVIKEKEMIS
jgi:flagellar basal body-associated protein FliL